MSQRWHIIPPANKTKRKTNRDAHTSVVHARLPWWVTIWVTTWRLQSKTEVVTSEGRPTTTTYPLSKIGNTNELTLSIHDIANAPWHAWMLVHDLTFGPVVLSSHFFSLWHYTTSRSLRGYLNICRLDSTLRKQTHTCKVLMWRYAPVMWTNNAHASSFSRKEQHLAYSLVHGSICRRLVLSFTCLSCKCLKCSSHRTFSFVSVLWCDK